MTVIDPTLWIREFATLIDENVDQLTELDAAIGDADHGGNMRRGTAAAVAALDANPPTSAADALKRTGMALIQTVGGASGPLYGTFFLRCAAVTDAQLDIAGFATAFRAGLEGIVARGKAEPGDKTMYDALAPVADILYESATAGGDLMWALDAAVAAATAGLDATKPMQARKGRASYLGERSVGHVDPGAASARLLVLAAQRAAR
ncbi:dihydroxyacetone kinase subunit DhaL [Nocardia sp. NPDC005998]|uniref:dihydroxyacetone kinase subunit DhaL n=1 Tax=Nocardia sp. NPDC005998 TaxID=3156894 RepID=UPI0033B7644E